MENQEQQQQETAPVEQPEVIEQPEVSAEKDFEGGFNAANGIEPAPEPEPEPTQEELDKALAERLGIASLAEDLKRLRSSNDKVSGLTGSLKQQIEQFRSQVSQASPVEISEEDFAELKQEYPELSQTLLPGLSRILSRRVPTQQEQVREVLEDKPVGLSREQLSMQDELTMRHEDWREVTRSDDYRAWVEALPEAKRRVAENSWSVAAAAAVLDEYKASRAPKQTQNRQERLEAAVTPRGKQTTPAQTNEDAFTAGFQSVRSGRL